MKYSVGHPAYPASSCNRYSICDSLAKTANELVSRGVTKSNAIAACNLAASGNHATARVGITGVIEVRRGL